VTVNAEAQGYDVIVIGSGPGGYVCAIRAAQLGLRTAIVEKETAMGGTCLNWGCIPTKALLHAADLFAEIQRAASFGIRVDAPSVDMKKLHQYRQRVVAKNAKGVEFLMKKNKVDVHRGFGAVTAPGTVTVQPHGGEATSLSTRHIVVACGSAPRNIPGFEFDGERVISSNEALTLDHVPERLAVLGAGAVGVEFASIYSRLGSQVTLIELLPHILPFEDEEVARELERAFRKQGLEVMAGCRAESLDKGEHLTLQVRQGGGDDGDDGTVQEVACDLLLVAVGRGPVSEGVGLAEVGVEVDRGFVRVNERLETGVPGIHAIGDIIALPDRPHPQLAHVASHEGVHVAELIAGHTTEPLNYDQIPGCTYCSPEVASVGLTEAAARERGHDVRVGKFPFSANSKSSVLLETVGFVKIVADARYDELLGVHIIGPHATDLIAEGVTALKLESTSEALFRAIHPHPTLSEAIGEAAHGVHGAPIHM
jgi:dihydrolipoamide dehydrogenase